MEELLVFLELLGTAAFAVSGAMTALRRSLDPLGVVVLGLITAVGGGVDFVPPVSKRYGGPAFGQHGGHGHSFSGGPFPLESAPGQGTGRIKKTSVLQTEVFSAYQKKPRRVCRPQAAKK